MSKLRKILADEGLLKTGSLLNSQVEAAIRALDLEAFAKALDDRYGDDAYIYLDDGRREVRNFAREEGLDEKAVSQILYDADNALFRLRMKREKQEIARSPWKKELKTLAAVFTSTVGPRDVPYIKWQPKRRKGEYVSATLIDMDGQLGNMRAHVDESWARQNGTTLKRVFEALDAMGAKMVTRGLGPGKKKPWIDHDGWAY